MPSSGTPSQGDSPSGKAAAGSDSPWRFVLEASPALFPNRAGTIESRAERARDGRRAAIRTVGRAEALSTLSAMSRSLRREAGAQVSSSSSDASEEDDETCAPASRRSDRDIALRVESASALPTVRIAARRPSRARSARDSIVPARLGNNAGDASSTKRQGESDPAAALPEGLSPWLGVPEEGMTLASDAPPACRARPER